MSITVMNRSSTRMPARPLQRAARSALKREGVTRAEVSIVLTGDDEIQRLNRQYRSIDKPTDVLSFPLRSAQSADSAPAIPGLAEPLGDVVVSVDTATRQAQEHAHSLEDELSLLVIHGILHLLGYDDETESGAEMMRSKEQEALRELEIETAGLVERAQR